MGTSGPAPGATREDLRAFVRMYNYNLERLGAAWGGPKGPGVSQRLAGNPGVSSEQVEITLAELGLDPVEFHLGVATRFHPELELEVFTKPRQRAVTRFLNRIRQQPLSHRYSPAKLAEMTADLERLRFRKAGAARNRAFEILRCGDLEPDVAAEAWGVLGVLQRHRGYVALAACSLTQALRSRPSPTVRARTLQRVAMLLFFNAGRPDQACQAIGRARALYLQAGDLAGVGKTFVDEAVVHSNCGEYRLARRAHLTALRLLPDDSLINRFAALQGLAVAAVFLGDVEEAFHHLQLAMAALPEDASWLYHRASVRWLQGELSLLLGQYEQASEHFAAVWDAFLDLNFGPLEMTLISLRIAKTCWLQGDRPALRQSLQELVVREHQVQRSHPLVAPVLGELLRQSAEGAVTAELLDEVYLKIREGAQSAPPLLPDRLPA
jgi:tetratricopeptide (TPR) repeat protein